MRRVAAWLFALSSMVAMTCVKSAVAENASGDYSPALRNRIASAISPFKSPPSTKVRKSGGTKPLLAGVTDLPNGSILQVSLKKPSVCSNNNCVTPTLPDGKSGDRVVVRNGGFLAGPFSFAGSPLPPGTYPIEILLETGDPADKFFQVGVDQVIIKPEKDSLRN